MLQTSVPPAEQPSIQFTFDFLFGDDPFQKIAALTSYLSKERAACGPPEGLPEGGDKPEGALCRLFPPGDMQRWQVQVGRLAPLS